MSFNFGSFAGGVAKTWDPKVIGGAINQGMLNQDVQAAEDKAEEDKAALEHLKKAQTQKAIRFTDDTGEMKEFAGSKAVSDDWIKKQEAASASNRTQAIKDAYTKWKSPEAYNNYLKSEAEGSKASFEKMFTDMKMGMTKEFESWDSGTPEGNQAMFEAAQKQGLVPVGATFDAKNMTMSIPGTNGQATVTQITPDMISSTKDALQLNRLKALYKLDPVQRKAISDMSVAERTEDERVQNAGLKNDEIRAKIAYMNDRGQFYRNAGKGPGGKGSGATPKPLKVTLSDPNEYGAQIERDSVTQQPTGYSQDSRGNRWPSEFPTMQSYQEAMASAKKAGVELVRNQEGRVGYRAGARVFNSLSQANEFAMQYADKVNRDAKETTQKRRQKEKEALINERRQAISTFGNKHRDTIRKAIEEEGGYFPYDETQELE